MIENIILGIGKGNINKLHHDTQRLVFERGRHFNEMRVMTYNLMYKYGIDKNTCEENVLKYQIGYRKT